MKEYKVVTHRDEPFAATNSENLEETLNKCATEGWQVANTVSRLQFSSGRSLIMVLERDSN